MYLLFPIGWMYYFGTNLENRFSVDGFWPTQEQSHKIPYEKEDLKAEIERYQRELRRKKDTESRLAQAALAFRQGDGSSTAESIGGVTTSAVADR